MAISCNPPDVAKAAACFQCIDQGMQMPVQLYLLAVIAGGSLDPKVLTAAAGAAKFQTIPKQMQVPVMDYLLCQIVNK